MTDSNDDPTDGLPMSRRGVLASVGGFAVLGGGVDVLANISPSLKHRAPTYVAKQGKLRYPLEPLSKDGETVREFYGYGDGGGTSANPSTDVIGTADAARVFFYDGPVSNSLVFLNGGPGMSHAGSVTLATSSFPTSDGEWAVKDDPAGVDDDFSQWSNSRKLTWSWGPHETDGGAFWGGWSGDFGVTLKPEAFRGVSSWRLLSTDGDATTADPNRYELSTAKPVKLKPGKRPVVSANVDIMPSHSENVFDPYAKGKLTVAVEQGGDAGPSDLDPGNYSYYFGSKRRLAGGNGAGVQQSMKRGGTLYLQFKTKAAGFSIEDDRGYLVGKTTNGEWLRGSDSVTPGGFDGSGSKGTGELSVADVHAAAKKPVKEFVAFENTGSASVDLTGWTVWNESNDGYLFPDGASVAPGETIRLVTGPGDDGGGVFYWDKATDVWPDDGGTVLVKDDAGDAVIEYTYPSA